jgi:hypothetical protein
VTFERKEISMATTVNSIEEFEKYLSDSSNKGKAFIVPKNVFRHYSSRLRVTKPAKKELEELSALLRHPIDDADKMGLTRTCVCPKCKHEFTFADHFKVAMETGIHSREQLVEFTTSAKEGRYYLVIDTDEDVTMICPNCGNRFLSTRCCYSTSSYAYT